MSKIIDEKLDYHLHPDEALTPDEFNEYYRISQKRNVFYANCNNIEYSPDHIFNNYEEYYAFRWRADEFCANENFDNEEDIQWRTIPGFSAYKISEEGEIISYIKPSKPRKLKYYHNQYGHQYVDIIDDNDIRRKRLVHRLVAMTFLKNPNNLPIVMHKDDNPKNNSISNIHWGTSYDNVHDCIDKERNFTKKVYCFDNNKIYRSCAEAAEDINVARSLITVCCQGKVHSAKGMIFCYLEDKDKISVNELALRRAHAKGTRPILGINRTTGERKIFDSRKAAADFLGISSCNISSCVNGYLSHVRGWTFKNIEVEDYYGQNY